MKAMSPDNEFARSAASTPPPIWLRDAVPPAWTPGPPPLPRHSLRHRILAAALFLLTALSTSFTWGPSYGLAVMVILLSHEMGHYLMCRRYRVPSTLPLFIPMPVISPFGTMGAVILMRQAGRTRKELFDIGIAGPLAGLIPSVAAIVWGLYHSQVLPTAAPPGVGMRLGESLLMSALEKAVYPQLPEQAELLLHPVAYAGWAGLFVTALNLLPVGQLDGGHVVYGILGRRSVWVSWAVLAGLAVLAVFHPQWWVLVAVLFLVVGPRHRPALDESVPVDRNRVLLGAFALAVFVLCFTPEPFLLK